MVIFAALLIPAIRFVDAQVNVSEAISKTVNDVLSNSMGGGFQSTIDKLLNGSSSNSKPNNFLGIEPSTIPIIEPSNTSNGNGTIIYTDPSVSSGILEAQNVDTKPNSNSTSPNENFVQSGNSTITNTSNQFKPVTNEVTNQAQQYGLGQLFESFKKFLP